MKKLKITLILNALFSFTTGLLSSIYATELASFLSVKQPIILTIIGIGLIIFATDVFYVAFKKVEVQKRVQGIIIADYGWVIGSVLLLIIRPVDFSIEANILIVSIAFIVLCFGILQRKFNTKKSPLN